MPHKYEHLREARQPYFNSKCCTNISNGCKICNPPRPDGLSNFSNLHRYLPAMSFSKVLCVDNQNCKESNNCKGKGFIVNVSVYDEERFEIVKKAEDYIEFQKEYCCVEEKAVPYDFGKVLIDGYLENKKKCT